MSDRPPDRCDGMLDEDYESLGRAGRVISCTLAGRSHLRGEAAL
jgi:hypothetical protein